MFLTVITLIFNLNANSIVTISGNAELSMPEHSIILVNTIHVKSNGSLIAWGPSNVPNSEFLRDSGSYISLDIENLTIAINESNHPVISWTGKQNAVQYNVYRDTTPAFLNSTNFQVFQPFFIDSDVQLSNRYFYYITWED